MKVVAPFGFYGWGNIGDEATLQGFARLVGEVAPQLRVWVGSRNPAHTALVEPAFRYFDATGSGLRSRWARAGAQAHVIAGGTPIMDGLGAWPLCELVPLVSSATRTGAPIAFVGSGVEGLHREESRKLVAEELGPRVCHWTVRSEKDRQRLESSGIPGGRVSVAADLAWLLSPAAPDFGKGMLERLGLPVAGNYVGVNVNAERSMLEQEPQLLGRLAEALDNLVETGNVRVLFLCNEVREGDTFDKAASLQTIAQMNHNTKATLVPNEYFTPQQMLSLVAQCRFTISTRYHFCLFSAMQSVPFIALTRSDKVADLCWDLGWPYAVPLRGLDASFPNELLACLRKGSGSPAGQLAMRTTAMRERALVNRRGLEALMANPLLSTMSAVVRQALTRAGIRQ